MKHLIKMTSASSELRRDVRLFTQTGITANDYQGGRPIEREWEVWSKEGTRPPNVPAHPESAYKDGGWQGWGGSVSVVDPSRKATLMYVMSAQAQGLTGDVRMLRIMDAVQACMAAAGV